MIDLLKQHTSVRSYTDEGIDDATLYEMLEAGQHASSSHFVQAYSVIHVTDAEKKAKLAELSNNERQINSAPVTLLFCADLKRLEIASSLHETEFVADYAENFLVAVIDTALFAQNVAVAAESKGYGICYIGGVRNEITAISELFNLPDFVLPLFAMTIGVPVKRNEVKPRLPLAAILHENTYVTDHYKEELAKYDQMMRDYYIRRTKNKKDTNWTTEMAKFYRKPRREHMKQFIESKGFNLH